jgi:uncharacterized protein YcnI
MARNRKSPSRILTAVLVGTLLPLAAILALAGTASARVVVLPATAPGGSTQTFAVRLANERLDVAATRLELTFPADAVVPSAKVAPADGWTSRVVMRPLDKPVRVAGQEVGEAVSAIVWEGGRVGRQQFAQFLVTAGPLPAQGRLVLAAAMTYSDGSVERWNTPAEPGQEKAAAPAIGLVPPVTTTPAGPPSPSAQADPAVTAADPALSGDRVGQLPMIIIGAGLALLGIVGLLHLWSRRAPRRRRSGAHAAGAVAAAHSTAATETAAEVPDRTAVLPAVPVSLPAALPVSVGPVADRERVPTTPAVRPDRVPDSGRHRLDPVPVGDDGATVVLDRVPAWTPDTTVDAATERLPVVQGAYR